MVVGVVLVMRPFASLAVLLVLVVAGLVILGLRAAVDPATGRRHRVLMAAVYLGAAAAVLLWPGPSIRVVAVVVGLALVVEGVVDVVSGVRSRGAARANGVLVGAASVVFGLLALAWPDVTVLVVAVTLGARLVLAGIRQCVAALRPGSPARSPGRARSGLLAWLRVGGSLVALLVAGVLVVVSVELHRAAPTPDAFYDAPADIPTQPGTLLRSEPFTRAVPTGAQAWRILYTTTRDDNHPAVASGIVVVPTGATAGPRPVIAWAHGTTGAAPGCAPSLLDQPFESGALFVLDQVIANGWALVATDYVGLGTAGPHPYLIGQGEARSVLDAVRAAHQLQDADLTPDTVVWGHSQGGNAALWTGMLPPDYAPDVKIDGVAALAPAANLPALVDNLNTITGGTLFASFVITSYAAIYPDVKIDDYVRPGARIIVEESATHCVGSDPGVLVSILESLVLDGPIWKGNPDRGTFASRLQQNVPSGPIRAPLLIAQGEADTLVIPSAQQAYVTQLCQSGQRVDYRSYPGRDHVPLVQPDSPLIPQLLAWTRDRLAAETPTNTCR